MEEKSSSLFHIHNGNCSANGLRDILDGRVLPWMSLMHCSPHQSRVKGNFCKVYSVNCFGQTGKRLKPTNDYNWQHRRGRFSKKSKNWIQLFCSQTRCLAVSVRLFISFQLSIVYSYSLLMHKLWNRKNITDSECLLIGGETESLSWTQKPPTCFVI